MIYLAQYRQAGIKIIPEIKIIAVCFADGHIVFLYITIKSCINSFSWRVKHLIYEFRMEPVLICTALYFTYEISSVRLGFCIHQKNVVFLYFFGKSLIDWCKNCNEILDNKAYFITIFFEIVVIYCFG